MNFNQKYRSMLIVSYFCGIGLLLTTVLGGLRTIIDGTPFFQMLEAPVFIAIVALFVGILFCEVKARIKNRLLAAAVFGLLSPQIFFLFLFGSDTFLGREPKSMPSEFYIDITLMMGIAASAIYLGIVRSKT